MRDLARVDVDTVRRSPRWASPKPRGSSRHTWSGQRKRSAPTRTSWLTCWRKKWRCGGRATCAPGSAWLTSLSAKTLEQFDFTFQPSIDERQIRELRTLRFVHDANNVISLGPPAREMSIENGATSAMS